MSEEHKEKNLTQCKKCKQLKYRILDGYYPSGDKKWIDEEGRQWMGKTCPYCNQKRAKEIMNGKRKKDKEETKND